MRRKKTRRRCCPGAAYHGKEAAELGQVRLRDVQQRNGRIRKLLSALRQEDRRGEKMKSVRMTAIVDFDYEVPDCMEDNKELISECAHDELEHVLGQRVDVHGVVVLDDDRTTLEGIKGALQGLARMFGIFVDV